MHIVWRYIRAHVRPLLWLMAATACLIWLLLYKLGTLTAGLSPNEGIVAIQPVGWHGIYYHPLGLPLEIIRSIVFMLFPEHGAFLTRLPNTLFGGLAIISFGWLIWLWHGPRTMVLSTILFACGAWILHISRIASPDVLYLWATPTLLLAQLGLQQYAKRSIIWYGSLFVIGLLLTIPGLIWFVLLLAYIQRKVLIFGWKKYRLWWQRTASIFVPSVWLPLIGIDLLRRGELLHWLGLPNHFNSFGLLLKQFIGVPVHLFIRGPQYPTIWLGRAPILDIFALVMCVVGIYFYARHWKSKRSRLLGIFSLIGLTLIGLGGPVSLSLLVPLAYMATATGVAYLLHDWLKVFPRNPLARGLGIGLVSLAVVLSCCYNLRAYFIAWPHNAITKASFRVDGP